MVSYPKAQEGMYFIDPQTTICDYDVNCDLTLFAFLKLQQDAAEKHISSLGCDCDNMIAHKLAFLVNKTRNIIYRMPKYGENFRLYTWNIGTKGVRFRRGFLWYSDNGELLAHGCNIYVLVNTETHRPLRPNALFFDLEEHPDYEDPAISLDSDMSLTNPSLVGRKTVTYSDLDLNRHLNNARYAALLQDNLPEDRRSAENIRSFAIDFIKEVPLGTQLEIFSETSEGHTVIKGTAQGRDRFLGRVDYAN